MSSITPLRRYAPSPRQESRDLRKTGLDPDYWYPLARSKQLKPGKSLAVTFAG